MNRFSGTDEADKEDEVHLDNPRVMTNETQEKPKKKRHYEMTPARLEAVERMKAGKRKQIEVIKKMKEEGKDVNDILKAGRPRLNKPKKEKGIYKKFLEDAPDLEEVKEEEGVSAPLPPPDLEEVKGKGEQPKEEGVREEPPPEVKEQPKEQPLVKSKSKKSKKIIIVQPDSETDTDEDIEIVAPKRRHKHKEEINYLKQELETMKSYLQPRREDPKINEMVLKLLGGRIR
jgi:hypothetical protein